MTKMAMIYSPLKYFALAGITIFMISCSSDKKEELPPVSPVERSKPAPPQKTEPEPLRISYQLDSLESAAAVDSFAQRYSEAEKEIIFGINRMDPNRLSAGDRIVIPDTLTSDFLDYAPFPRKYRILDTIPKAVLISRRTQAFALYQKGELVRWGPVSSGKESTPTPAGLFYGNYKARKKVSTVDPSWLMPYYFNFMNFEGVGVHQYSMPGYPASHACVRLRMKDAVHIYDWAEQWKLDPSGTTIVHNGTPFMVFGNYDYQQEVPWLKLAEDPQALHLNSEEKEVLESYVAGYLRDERNFSERVDPEEKLSSPPGSLESVKTGISP